MRKLDRLRRRYVRQAEAARARPDGTLQELADEAFADLLEETGIPIDLKDALRKSAALTKTPGEKSGSSPRRKKPFMSDPDPFEQGERAARKNIPAEANPYRDVRRACAVGRRPRTGRGPDRGRRIRGQMKSRSAFSSESLPRTRCGLDTGSRQENASAERDSGQAYLLQAFFESRPVGT